jgi:hypothetical protein
VEGRTYHYHFVGLLRHITTLLSTLSTCLCAQFAVFHTLMFITLFAHASYNLAQAMQICFTNSLSPDINWEAVQQTVAQSRSNWIHLSSIFTSCSLALFFLFTLIIQDPLKSTNIVVGSVGLGPGM